MYNGFVKVCAVTPKIRVADVEFNCGQIVAAAKKAAARGAQVIVFPELCVCGYTCGDLFNQPVLIKGVEAGVIKIAEELKDTDALCFVGAPVCVKGELFNCAVALCRGKILGVVPKKYLPNYGEFYERRNFSPAKNWFEVECFGQIVKFSTKLMFVSNTCSDFTVACEICEDLWAPNSPSVKHAVSGANIIVNLSCSDETVGKAEYRRDLVKVQSAKLNCAYVYCDSGDGESTTDMVFAAHDIICENGCVLSESKPFGDGVAYADIDLDRLAAERRRTAATFRYEKEDEYLRAYFTLQDRPFEFDRTFEKMPFVPAQTGDLSDRANLILNIQAKGLEQRLKHIGAKCAVLGVSGGLDSSLALLVTRRAFVSLGWDLKNIIAVTMPGFGTTSRTLDNSMKLMSLLGVSCKKIPIGNTVQSHFKDIGLDGNDRGVTYENAQARMRTMVLMDVANQNNGLVVGTGDLSELALGWATYNGDHMSMYGVNCSVPKTLVKYLVAKEAENLGGECEQVLKDVLSTDISPELLPPDEEGKIEQKTEDIVGPYILHDFFLYYALRWAFAPEKIRFIANLAFKGEFTDEQIVKWLKNFYKRFFSQQFKRSCSPDGVKVGSVSLSPRGDWRMPSDAIAKLWLDNI